MRIPRLVSIFGILTSALSAIAAERYIANIHIFMNWEAISALGQIIGAIVVITF